MHDMYDQLRKDLQAVLGRVHQWIDRCFPEYMTVFANWEGQSSLQVLKMGLFSDEIWNGIAIQIKGEAVNEKIICY
ncbi:hypothetical protein SAMN05421787_10648 [Virgibacillus pantothenticus]|nr:hypothetical protein SAMN05421787_10648 [Virgibacillus pantothenticus]